MKSALHGETERLDWAWGWSKELLEGWLAMAYIPSSRLDLVCKFRSKAMSRSTTTSNQIVQVVSMCI